MLKFNNNSVNAMNCEQLKEYAFNSHPDCYLNPGYGSKGICYLWASKNGVGLFNTVGSALLDKEGMIQVWI